VERNRKFDPVEFSPDGRWVVYVYGGALWSVPSRGGRPVRLSLRYPLDSVTGLTGISRNSSTVVYRADLDHRGTQDVYSVSIRGGESYRLSSLPPGGRLSCVLDPTGARVVYRANQDQAEVWELFSVPIHGGPATKLNPPLVSGGDVWGSRISPDGATVVYRADQVTDEVYEVFSVPITGGPPKQLSRAVFTGRSASYWFDISPDGAWVAYAANQDVEDRTELFSAPIRGGISTKLNGEMVPGGRVERIEFSPESMRVIYNAVQETPDQLELYSVAIGGGSWTKLSPEPALGPEIWWDFSVGGTSVIYYNRDEIYGVPIEGGESERLHGLLDTTIRNLIVGPGSSTVAFRPYTYDLHMAGYPTDSDGDGIVSMCDVCPEYHDPGQSDSDGDGFGTLCDCRDNFDTIFPGAPEVNDGLDNQCPGDAGFLLIDEIDGVTGFFDPQSKTEVSWTGQPGATQYEVARSATHDFSTGCVRVLRSGTAWSDNEEPPPGRSFFYLVRATAPNVGSWGADSTGAERTGVCP